MPAMNPESKTSHHIHDAACALMHEHLDAQADDEDQLYTLLGRRDQRATAVVGGVGQMAAPVLRC